MKYLNLLTALHNGEPCMRATNEQLGTWFHLVSYCHEQMNGGTIIGCKDWPDQMWARIANTTGSFIAQECPLWHFSGVALLVEHYNLDAENAYRKKQRMGRLYVERRWAAQKQKKIIQMESGNHGNTQKTNES